jgi:uncharacterized protein (DUF488 family)
MATVTSRRTGSLVSVGYEGRDLDGLIDRLVELDVSVLVDVRLNAISRKQGLSKNALRSALEEEGIEYLHLPALGNPRDNREAFRAGSVVARRRFIRSLATVDGKAALDALAEAASGAIVAILCFEADHELCHRACVIEAVQERHPRFATIRA